MAKDGKRKILRVGIIQSGRIVEERLIRKHQDVSIGQASKNTFILPASHLPKSYTLFEGKGGGYHLIFDDRMEGRVSIGEEVLDLKSLAKSGSARRRGGRSTVELDERSRGKIVVGEFTFLFQFIDAPPVLPKPQLPAAARGANVDWLFVNILIVTGLVLGGGGSGLDFWWRDTGQYMQVEFGKKTRAYEMLKAEVLQEKEKEKEDEPEPEEEEEEDDAEAVEEVVEAKPEPKAKPKRAKPAPVKDEGKAPERKTNRSKGEILDSVKKKTVLHTLTALGGEGGGNLADTLAGGLGNSKLDAAFNNSDGGVTGATAGVRKEFEGQPVAVKTGQAGYKGLGKGVGGGRIKTTKAKVADKAASGGEVKIRARAKVGSLGGAGGSGQIDKKGVSRVLRRRSGAVKRCYEKALKRNENVNGKLTVKFQIGTAGRITRIKVTKNGTGDAGVASCITSAMKGWRFPIPEGGPVTFSFPFILSKG